jgi:hypothetical protein
MMLCALTFAADMAAGLTEVEEKNLRRNEMLGNVVVVLAEWGSLMRDSRGGPLYSSSVWLKGKYL